MVKILFIIPYDELRSKINTLITSVQPDDVVLEAKHFLGANVEELRTNADIIVARGITCLALQKAYPERTVVEISVTGYDIMRAYLEGKTKKKVKHVALITADPVLCDVTVLETVTGVSFMLYKIQDESQATTAISLARQNGADMIIAGLTVCRMCKDSGLPAITIRTGDEAIEQAFNEALSAAGVMNHERTKNKLMEMVIQNTKDSTLSVDRSGKIILANSSAARLFGLKQSAEAVGRHIDDLYPHSGWEETLQRGEESEGVQHIGRWLAFVVRAPIVVDGHTAGVMFTVQRADKIQEKETKIRSELAKKGLVAHYRFENIISSSVALNRQIEMARKYSYVDSNVFITGESGTGKELFAQSIHNASARSKEPFVAINCAALPENLLESELFGYVDGAFSGAAKGGKTGLFELAHRGTIFLDEIGEFPHSLQAKLLRAIQEKEIRPVGGDKVVFIDVRIISATNIKIQEKIAAGQFREDLYYRLNTLSINTPPLRERREDIADIARYFISQYADKFTKPNIRLTPDAISFLEQQQWSGNVRELRNVCERIVVLGEGDNITVEDIRWIYQPLSDPEPLPPAQPVAEPEGNTTLVTREQELLRILTGEKTSKSELAKMLGMSRTTLWRRMKQLQEQSEKKD